MTEDRLKEIETEAELSEHADPLVVLELVAEIRRLHEERKGYRIDAKEEIEWRDHKRDE